MPKNKQWSVTLDEYHQFAVEQFVGVFGNARSSVIRHMVHSWVSTHPDQVSQAGAAIDDWRRSREDSS